MDFVDGTRLNSWRLVLQVNTELSQILELRLEKEFGLKLKWYDVLFYLRNAEGRRLRMSQLAESLALRPSAATRFIDRMEKAGLVKRKPSDEDRRVTYVTMAKRGADAFERAAPVYVRTVGEHFAKHLSMADARVLNRALDNVLANSRGLGRQ